MMTYNELEKCVDSFAKLGVGYEKSKSSYKLPEVTGYVFNISKGAKLKHNNRVIWFDVFDIMRPTHTDFIYWVKSQPLSVIWGITEQHAPELLMDILYIIPKIILL